MKYNDVRQPDSTALSNVIEACVYDIVYVPDLLKKISEYDPPAYALKELDEFENEVMDALKGIRIQRLGRSKYSAVYYDNAPFTNGVLCFDDDEYQVYSANIRNKRYSWGRNQKKAASTDLKRAVANAKRYLLPVRPDTVFRAVDGGNIEDLHKKAKEQSMTDYEAAKEKLVGRFGSLDKRVAQLITDLQDGLRWVNNTHPEINRLLPESTRVAMENLDHYHKTLQEAQSAEAYISKYSLIYVEPQHATKRAWVKGKYSEALPYLGALPDDILGLMAVADMVPIGELAAGVGGRVAPHVYLLFNTAINEDGKNTPVILNSEY